VAEVESRSIVESRLGKDGGESAFDPLQTLDRLLGSREGGIMDALAARRTFSPLHARDRSFFAVFLAACWLGVLFGFYRASSLRFAGHADYPAPPILVAHAILFSAWLALLTTQILFVRTKRLRLHKKLGRVAIVLVPLMVYSAVAAEVHSQRFYIQRHDDDLHFFILPLFYAAAFGVLGTWAWLVAKKDGEVVGTVATAR